MISSSLLIDDCYAKDNSGIVGSWDFEYLIPFVKISQDINLSQLIGEALLLRLYEGVNTDPDTLTADERALLINYIQPVVLHFALYRGMDNLGLKIDNSGLVRRNSENGTAVELSETSYLGDKEKTIAESYGKRLVDFLDANADLYPQYKDEVLGQIKPSNTPSFSGGMYLGRSTNNCNTD